MNDDMIDGWEDVEILLESDLEDFEGELGELYNRIERYAETAEVVESMGRNDDAEYYRELAVDSYKSFAYVIQLKTDADDYFDQ